MNSKKKVFAGLLGNAWAELQVRSHPSTHRLRPLSPGGSRLTRPPTQRGCPATQGGRDGASSPCRGGKALAPMCRPLGLECHCSLDLEIFLGSQSSECGLNRPPNWWAHRAAESGASKMEHVGQSSLHPKWACNEATQASTGLAEFSFPHSLTKPLGLMKSGDQN